MTLFQSPFPYTKVALYPFRLLNTLELQAKQRPAPGSKFDSLIKKPNCILLKFLAQSQQLIRVFRPGTCLF